MKKEDKNDIRLFRALVIWTIFVLAMTLACVALLKPASANVFDDIESGLAEHLGTTNMVAGYLIAAGLVGAVLIALAIMGVNPFAELIAAIAMLAFCAVVGWIDFWLLLLAAIILVLWFSSKMAPMLSGRPGE